MSYPKEGLAGIVGVILKEGLVGHSQCHTKRRIGRAWLVSYKIEPQLVTYRPNMFLKSG